MLWDEQTSLESGVGYKDNVLLSALNPQGSGFFINGLNAVVVRVPLDGWQIVASIVGDDIRYWRDVGTSGEDLFISSLRIQRDLPDGWQTGLEARGLFENRVLDIKTSQGVPATALVKGYAITAKPWVRKSLTDRLRLKLEMPVTRWYLNSPLDNYWDIGPVLSVECEFGERTEVSWRYGASYQPHDEWVALDAFGRPLSKRLVIWQHRAELAWHRFWDAHRNWQSGTRFIFSYRDDNGAGYFNYYQYQVVMDLRWQTADWEIKGSAQLAFEDYPVQGTGILNGQTLYRELVNLTLEAERRLYKGLKTFAKLEYQQAISNEAGDAGDYKGTTVSAGLRYEF